MEGSKFFVVKLIHMEFIVKRLDVTQLEVRDSENVNILIFLRLVCCVLRTFLVVGVV